MHEQFPWSHKQIAGALRSCINDHGPVNNKLIASAAKRIINQLYGASAPTVVVERLEGVQRKMNALEARNKELKDRVEELEEPVREMFASGLLNEDHHTGRDRLCLMRLRKSLKRGEE